MVIDGLVKEQYRVTRVASTGGFLRRGNTTILMGVEEEQIEPALDIIRALCLDGHEREVGEKHATIFVLDVDQHVQI
jgi:uncharacterized protein YaaQ